MRPVEESTSQTLYINKSLRDLKAQIFNRKLRKYGSDAYASCSRCPPRNSAFLPFLSGHRLAAGCSQGWVLFVFLNLRSSFVLAIFHHEGFCCRRAAARWVEQRIVPSQFSVLISLLLSMLLFHRGEVRPLLLPYLPMSPRTYLQKMLLLVPPRHL